jgi:ABC-type multidrug transport system ATPase subunit
MAAVKIEQLVKLYKNKKEITKAVKGISIDVAAGELFGIIGPDGAGKTSLFRMLTTLLLPDGGNAFVDGHHIVKEYRQIRRKVGYMPGKFSLYQDLTVEENLEFFATIFNTTVKANYHLIRDIYEQIAPFKNRKAGKLSGGMKQKLALSCALIHRPVVLFLDEPTTGVDAVSRKEFWEMLQQLKQQGITIMVSTPYMDEAALCDRVTLMQEGTALSTGTPAAIIESFQKSILAIRSENMYRLLRDLQDNEQVEDSYAFGEFHHAVMKDGYNETMLKNHLEQKGHARLKVELTRPGIEDCFLKLMKQP